MIPVWVCMALAGVLGYYVASMLLEKSLRVFRGSLPGVAAVCVGAALVCGTVSMDVFGAERWAPDPSEVEMVYLGDYEVQFSADQTEPEKLQQIIDIHRAIVEDRNYIRESSPGAGHSQARSPPPRPGGGRRIRLGSPPPAGWSPRPREKLIELGYVTEAEISQWNQEMGLEDSGPIPADTVVRLRLVSPARRVPARPGQQIIRRLPRRRPAPEPPAEVP